MAQPFQLDPLVTERIRTACEGMFQTALECQRIIRESRELLAQVDALVDGDLLLPKATRLKFR